MLIFDYILYFMYLVIFFRKTKKKMLDQLLHSIENPNKVEKKDHQLERHQFVWERERDTIY